MALLTTEQRIIAQATNGAATVWTGRPLPGFRLRKGDAGQLAPLLFAIPFFIFWETMVLRMGGDADVGGIAFPFFGLIVFALILAQLCGPVLWSLYSRGRTYYALTADGYAVIFTDLFGRSTKRVYLPSLSTIDLDTRGDGSGSICFGQFASPPCWARNRSAVPRPPSFDCIASVSAVYDLCTKLQQGKAV